MTYPAHGPRSLIMLLTGGFLLLGTACGRGGLDGAKGHAPAGPGIPQPPPAGTLALDLDLGGSSPGFSGTNHRQALAHVQAFNISVGSRLVVPAAILSGTSSANPVLSAQDTWVWSYLVSGQNRDWTANVTGQKLSDTATKWQARVTSTPVDAAGCCKDLLLFEGERSIAGSGTWQLYDMSKSMRPEKLLSIVYGYDSETKRMVQFTVNSSRSASERFGTNSVIKYQIAGELIELQMNDSSEGATRTISWNSVTKAGSHSDLQGNRVCWGGVSEGFADLSCD